ncbi:putative ubiquitination network signaling protein acrB [Colletotrichum spaethianum]|uniref:Ubiquitination network signaling protein acrB n=1 Tax=Colletotrichum spaethianum TaxID=700344 RepID=A0AA37P6F7_9PEZI|nr:putative ubiquitination network signaling protein acrB [Colletotrichum spaethianum]GKT46296.1 putative ubiquitination network signaling protein acrB [Colletotrichum spaethianum]
MSYKAKLTDFMKKEKLDEDSHGLNHLPPDIRPDQPARKRSIWEKVEQKLRQRKKDSVPVAPPPAMEYPSASLNETKVSKEDVKMANLSASFQSNWGGNKNDGMDHALAYEPSHSLPPSSSNAWFSTTFSKTTDQPCSYSQPYSPSQPPTNDYLLFQGLYNPTSLSLSSVTSAINSLGKPVGRITSEPPAAYYSVQAYTFAHQNIPSFNITKAPIAHTVPIWMQENTDSAIDRKVMRHSANYLEAPTPPCAQFASPSIETMGKSTAPNDNHAVARTSVPGQITSFPATVTGLHQTILAQSSIPMSIPAHEEEQSLRDFVQRMTEHKCPDCNKDTIPFKASAVFVHAEKILTSKKHHCIFNCKHSRCRVSYCPGCSQISRASAIPFWSSAAATTANSTGASTWCCPSARLFFIFLLLCGPHAHPRHDLASLLQDRQVEVKPWTPRASASSSVNESASEGPHRLAGPAVGTGYGCSGDGQGSGGGLLQYVGDKSLELLPELFAKLRWAWPSTANSSEFDQNPPELLLSMTRRSPLMIKVAELLRDDCIEEVMRRAALYHSMFDFIKAVVAHPFSAPLVRDIRIEYPLARTLLPVCFGTADILAPAMQQPHSVDHKGKGKAKAPFEPPQDTLQSLASLLSSLTDQSRAVMHYLNAGSHNATDTLAMCQRICDLSDELGTSTIRTAGYRKVACSAQASSSSTTSAATVIAAVGPGAHEKKLEGMRTWLSRNKVTEFETDNWLNAYSFRRSLADTAESAPKPGRMKRIVYELSMLRTSVPEGILVRHDSSRLDAMKVLIVGPEGTPYENGLFEFDLFCPLEYPNTPPRMEFKTTRSGRKFNPNLYVDGKICLSLLDTWSGEKWCPRTSTLLQLLVSIQAMIFCADPIWNEPGSADGLGVHASDLYNWEMRADTLIFAMSDWLRERQKNAYGCGTGSGVWDEAVGNHFRLRWHWILETALRWEKENDPEVSFSTSGLGFIMPGKCAAKRFRVGIRRLKGYFAEWARTEEEWELVKIGSEDKSEAGIDNVPKGGQGKDQESHSFSTDSIQGSLSSLNLSE